MKKVVIEMLSVWVLITVGMSYDHGSSMAIVTLRLRLIWSWVVVRIAFWQEWATVDLCLFTMNTLQLELLLGFSYPLSGFTQVWPLAIGAFWYAEVSAKCRRTAIINWGLWVQVDKSPSGYWLLAGGTNTYFSTTARKLVGNKHPVWDTSNSKKPWRDCLHC